MVFADTASSGGSLLAYLPLLVIGAALYFVLIRPQNRRRREAMDMQRNVGPGDEVQTIGGLYGTVIEVDDESATIEAAPGVHLRFARPAIGKVLNKADQPAEDDVDDVDEDDSGNADAKNVVDRG